MEEMNGFDIAIKVLGERIAQLESDVRYERMMKEDALKKLEKVQHYIERMEEK